MKAMRTEVEQEADGRWIAEVPEAPGAMAYGETPDDASAAARRIAMTNDTDLAVILVTVMIWAPWYLLRFVVGGIADWTRARRRS